MEGGGVSWHDKFIARRKRMWYRDKIVGATLPKAHLRRPTRAAIMAAARRFVKDGEIRNAVEMIRLAYAPKQLDIYFRDRL